MSGGRIAKIFAAQERRLSDKRALPRWSFRASAAAMTELPLRSQSRSCFVCERWSSMILWFARTMPDGLQPPNAACAGQVRRQFVRAWPARMPQPVQKAVSMPRGGMPARRPCSGALAMGCTPASPFKARRGSTAPETSSGTMCIFLWCQTSAGLAQKPPSCSAPNRLPLPPARPCAPPCLPDDASAGGALFGRKCLPSAGGHQGWAKKPA